MNEGTLYICATPIGNLEDITFRVLRVLKEVDLIAAEDTRQTRKLLSHFDIHTPLTSYHQHNERGKGTQLLERLKEGQSVALVSDAGMPGISDPGAVLISLAIGEGIPVVSCPGASASLTALVLSGLDTNRFVFEGFLPREKKDRRKRLEILRREDRTLVFYESPHRLEETLKGMVEIFGEHRPASASRELTKKFEETRRGTLGELLEHFQREGPRGEFCLVVAGASAVELDEPGEGGEELRPIPEQVAAEMAAGYDKKEAMKRVAKGLGLSRRDVYQAMLENTDENP